MNKTADRLKRALIRMRAHHPDMTLTQAIMFLSIASMGDMRQSDVHSSLDIPDSTSSRNIAILGDIGGRTVPALNLIEIGVDPFDRRARVVRISPTGSKLLAQISKELGDDDTTAREQIPS